MYQPKPSLFYPQCSPSSSFSLPTRPSTSTSHHGTSSLGLETDAFDNLIWPADQLKKKHVQETDGSLQATPMPDLLLAHRTQQKRRGRCVRVHRHCSFERTTHRSFRQLFVLPRSSLGVQWSAPRFPTMSLLVCNMESGIHCFPMGCSGGRSACILRYHTDGKPHRSRGLRDARLPVRWREHRAQAISTSSKTSMTGVRSTRKPLAFQLNVSHKLGCNRR